MIPLNFLHEALTNGSFTEVPLCHFYFSNHFTVSEKYKYLHTRWFFAVQAGGPGQSFGNFDGNSHRNLHLYESTLTEISQNQNNSHTENIAFMKLPFVHLVIYQG